MLSGLLVGCALLTPLPRATTLDERLAAFPSGPMPVRDRVVVHWNEHQIPFIEASSDDDLAFALGLVHAHLRLGQMEALRHISQGRIAEMAGPLATDIDHSLRILDFGRAGAEIEAALPDESRRWLENFVRGVNYYQDHAARLPHEFAVLGLKREPWTVRDVLTAGRLAGTDVNWLVWFRLLKLRDRPDWPELWVRLVENGTDSLASFERGDELGVLSEILADTGRSGSNAVAVSAARSASGSALMASDPHLGIMVPNLWMIAGYKSPSYHAVGLMLPGFPFLAIGRNPRIAWSGTNMRAASSDLFDVSWMRSEDFSVRHETVAVRWWFDRDITVRESPYGPVLSDAPALDYGDRPAFALKWVGHQVTDEVTAMLKANRAGNWDEFRAAFESFAISAQNMLYADVDGNIGQLMAVRMPARPAGTPPDLILDPRQGTSRWDDLIGADRLPASYNPVAGFVASANNRPVEAGMPIGYFFSPDDRVRRMGELLDGDGKVDAGQLKEAQRDVYMSSAVALRDIFVERIEALGLAAEAGPGEREVIRLMREWDGRYDPDSRGAVAFELFLAPFMQALYARLFGEDDGRTFQGAARIKSLLAEDIRGSDHERLTGELRAALAQAADTVDGVKTWGDLHRLRLAHPLANLPLVGGRYAFADLAIGGSTDTLMKTAHGPVEGRHNTVYGSNARFVTDLGDLDRNDFVLLGGQDGWFQSAAFLDQVPLWQAGDYVRVPLRIETVRATFPRKSMLVPN